MSLVFYGIPIRIGVYSMESYWCVISLHSTWVLSLIFHTSWCMSWCVKYQRYHKTLRMKKVALIRRCHGVKTFWNYIFFFLVFFVYFNLTIKLCTINLTRYLQCEKRNKNTLKLVDLFKFSCLYFFIFFKRIRIDKVYESWWEIQLFAT